MVGNKNWLSLGKLQGYLLSGGMERICTASWSILTLRKRKQNGEPIVLYDAACRAFISGKVKEKLPLVKSLVKRGTYYDVYKVSHAELVAFERETEIAYRFSGEDAQKKCENFIKWSTRMQDKERKEKESIAVVTYPVGLTEDEINYLITYTPKTTHMARFIAELINISDEIKKQKEKRAIGTKGANRSRTRRGATPTVHEQA